MMKAISFRYFFYSKGILPPAFHFMNKMGIYVFKFYKNNKNVFVIIDDKLPINMDGNIIYARSENRMQ